jgi:hypothetical protein
MNASIRDAFSASFMAHLEGASNARCATHAITGTSCSADTAMLMSAKTAVATASEDNLK